MTGYSANISACDKANERVLDYCLRINHHASDHTDLILDGIGPGIARARADCNNLAIAMRANWQHGPHLLIGIKADSLPSQQNAASIIGQHALSWMKESPSDPITDGDAYRARSAALAEAEDIAFVWDGLRPTDTISPADYRVPDFLGDPRLSAIRDDFSSAALDVIVGVIALRRQHESLALVRLAKLFLTIEQLRGPAMLEFWPMSLHAQVRATRTATPDVFARLEKAATQLLPILEADMQTPSQDRMSTPEDATFADWLPNLSTLQQQIASYVGDLDKQYFDNLEAALVEKRREAVDVENLVPIAILARSHVHFCYRIFMNMIYNIFPTIGFSAWKRVLVACLVIKWLEINDPGVLDTMKAQGAQLAAPSSLT